MSADIWLEDENGERITVDSDPDAEMRDLVPFRSAGEVSSTTFNLTYNLSPMLWEAGMPRWRELVGMSASQAGPIWRDIHGKLAADPERFKAFNPENGWGTYEQAVEVIGALADACERHPEAKIGGWL